MMGIYKITNIINNKCYIGQSTNLKERVNWHKAELKRNRHYNKYLQASYNKYGLENFTFENIISLKEISHEDLNTLEEIIIRSFNSFKEGYNLTSGGDNREISEEEKLRRKETIPKEVFLNRVEAYIESKKIKVRVTNNLTNEIKDFDSIADACKFYNVHSRKVYRILKGIRKSTQNLKFEYI